MFQTKTAWQTVRMPKFPKLNTNLSCDVLVVGGGITGLTAAYLLKRAGKRVCLLERDRLAHGDTGCTTAHLTCVTDLRLSKLARFFGKASARLAWQGGLSAINTIEGISRGESIECEFRRVPGYLHASWEGKTDERKELAAEARLAEELGFAASFVESVPGIDKPGILFANQAKFHPLKYLAGLAKIVDGNGCSLFEESEATEFSEKPLSATVNGKRLECDYVVLATHVPLMGKTGIVNATLFQTKLMPYSTYAIGARIPDELAEASYWDTTDPYFYLRIDRHNGRSYAIFGGKDHKTGQEKKPKLLFGELERLLRKIIPGTKVDCQWSGQVIETNDGLPYIGQTAERQFAATGFSGNGMTFGTLAGMMACDAVLERTNPWQDLFSVSRKKIRGGTWDYLTENIDYPYYLVRDRLKGSEARSTREIKRGEGKVLKSEGKHVACSRDESGKLASVSAVCTHMGCIVHWNSAEQTWDCPCHGSRFRTTGEVLAGPAEAPLEKAPAPKALPSGGSEKRPRRRLAAAKTNR